MRDRLSFRFRIYSAGVGAVAAMVLLSAAPKSSSAGTSGSIHLAGQVFSRATLWLSRFSPSFSSFGTPNSVSDVTRKITSLGQVWLADLGISGNGSPFTVSVQSLNAKASGQPGLVDRDTGVMIPYHLTYGGSNLNFVHGEARLAAAPSTTERAPLPLALAIPPGSSVTNGRFAERLVLVVTAP